MSRSANYLNAWKRSRDWPKTMAVAAEGYADPAFCDPERALSPAAPTLVERLAWPVLLALAWLLFELTANATLSVMCACLKFGWDDFRTARWLKRTDPYPGRRAASFWFYLASAAWKTALVPIAAVMAISTAWCLFSPRAMHARDPVAQQVLSAATVGMVASAALIVLVAVAVGSSLWTGVRAWVHPDLHDSRRRNVWPPEWPRPLAAHENRGRAILATALVFATIGLPPLVFRWIIFLGPRLQLAAALAIVFGVPIAMTFTYAALRGRLFAASPWECWPESAARTLAALEENHSSSLRSLASTL